MPQHLQDPRTKPLKTPAPALACCLLVWTAWLALSSSGQLAFSLLLKLTAHQLESPCQGHWSLCLMLGTDSSSVSESGQVPCEVFTGCVLIISCTSQRGRQRQKKLTRWLGWGTRQRH